MVKPFQTFCYAVLELILQFHIFLAYCLQRITCTCLLPSFWVEVTGNAYCWLIVKGKPGLGDSFVTEPPHKIIFFFNCFWSLKIKVCTVTTIYYIDSMTSEQKQSK